MDKSLLAEIQAAREYADSQLTKEELDARDARHEVAHVDTSTTFWAAEEALSKQISEQNAFNASAQKERDKGAAERRIAENAANMSAHHAGNKPPEGWMDMQGLVPAPRNPSISLQTLPARFPSSDPREGFSDELIIAHGMNPNPLQPPFFKK